MYKKNMLMVNQTWHVYVEIDHPVVALFCEIAWRFGCVFLKSNLKKKSVSLGELLSEYSVRLHREIMNPRHQHRSGERVSCYTFCFSTSFVVLATSACLHLIESDQYF